MATTTVTGNTRKSNLTIADGAVTRVYDGGEVLTATIKKSGVLYVSKGGTATKPKISAGGTMYVSEGGKEFYTAVSNRGYLYIDGGRGSFTSIYSASYASVYGGGTIYEATLYDSARLNILDGGTADKTTLKKSAQLYVMVNGEASRTTAEGGKIFVNGGLANSTTLKAGGSMFVYEGQANSTTVGDGGTLLVSNGGTAFDTTANGNGLVTVSLGQADRTTINGTGSAKIYSGTMTSTTLSDSAKMYVYNLARADSVTLDNEAQMYVYGGGTARFVTMNGNGGIFVDGGQVSETIMKAGGTMNVRKSGTADSITVSKGGTLIVSGGGVVNSAIVRDQAFLEIGKSGRTEYAMVYGHVTLRAGGTMNHTTLSNGLHVSKGATVNDTTLGQLAGLHVSQGGTANGVIANNLGGVYVNGGTVNDAVLKKTCSMCVYDGGVANDTVLSSGGAVRVSQGGTANGVIVSKGGTAYIFQGGATNDAVVSNDGEVHVSQGGTLNSVTVNGGGRVFLHQGAKLTGQVTINDDPSVEGGIGAEDGSIVDFDLSTVAPGSTARINNMSMIYGSPDYTITVSTTIQRVGDYTLTDETGNFFGTFTVKSTVGDTLGTIGIDDNEDTLQWGDYTYSLSKTEGALTLTITSSDTTDPLPPTIKASTTALTNKNVILTATFSADTALKQYSTDAKNWYAYTSPLSVSKNGMYLFRAIDGAGNKSNIMTFTVDNIDKTAPKAPTVTVSTTKPTNQNVTITASFSKDSARKLYSTDKSIWKGYTKALEATQNGTYYFQGIDAAGNVSEVTTVTVSNIDKKAPAAPKVTPDTTTLTNKNVIVTVAIPSDAAKRQFSTDNKKWSDCNEDHPVSKNGTYYFRAVDAAGNVSKVTSVKISNIDKTAPEAPKVKSSNTKVTNKNVTLTATFSSDSAKKQYSTDNETWKTYSKAITVAKNGTYNFRGVDAAGNASKVTTLKVTNIDKTPPKAPTVKSSNSTRPTNKNITVTATFSSDSAKKEYSTDKKTWKTYSKAITVEKNGTYYFRATDAVGNVSEVTSFKVSNIDKTAPKAPTVKASTTKTTNKNVTLTATFSTDSTRPQYSTDNKTWRAYTEAVSASKNGTYYFRAIDAAGNVSKVTSIKVSNIDKTPPATPTVTVDSAKAREIGGKSVKVTATFSADSAKKQYSIDGGEWKDYTKALTVKSNKVIEFRGIDKAGNISRTKTLAVCYYMDKSNNKWEDATEAPEHILAGVNSSFDKVDYYDLEGISGLSIVMARGIIEASFYDSDRELIECTTDNGVTDSKFLITASDNPDKNARYFDAISDEVKYLKIKAADSGTGGYHLYSTLA